MSGHQILWAFSSVALISIFSLVGVVLLWLRSDLLDVAVILLVSFSSGSLFGDAFIHLLPSTVERHGFTVSVSLFTLAGIAGSFFLEKVVHWRHDHSPERGHIESFAYMNLLGDGLHNFLDGVVISSAYAMDIGVGVATTVAVLFHEIPQEMGDFGVLLHGGMSRRQALLYNFATALTAVAGAALAVLLIGQAESVTAILIPFAAGTFIYIAGSDLIPQLHRQREVRDSLMQLLFFALGIAAMLALRL